MTLPTSSLGKRVRCAAAAACCACAIPVPANAGFFDFLFPPQPQVVTPYYAPSYERQPHKKVVKIHPKIVVGKTHPTLQHVVSSVMEDESLKNGDAVMTEDGLRIFTGSRGSRHSSEDFARLSDIKKGLSKAQRSALLAIDAKGRAPAPALLDGRSIADPAPARGESITDPKGVKIRYVGP